MTNVVYKTFLTSNINIENDIDNRHKVHVPAHAHGSKPDYEFVELHTGERKPLFIIEMQKWQ